MPRLTSRMARLYQIEELLLLKADGLRAIEIAKQLKVDRRTIYRDLEFLDAQGVPLWQQDGHFGINRTRYLTTVRLSFHESMALVLAGLLFARTLDERNEHVAAALRKLAVTMPAQFGAQLKRAAERIELQQDQRQQVAVLATLAEGWGASQKVRVHYRSPRSGVVRERVIAPYVLEPTASGIYVIGYDEWAKAIRTFKLERLERPELLPERFTIPDSFNPDEYLATSWGIMQGTELSEVVLHFAPAATAHVHERRWHPSQTLETTADGGCILRVQVSEPLEMQPWIRSWGAQVEVLAPAKLREKIAAELQKAAALYATQAAASTLTNGTTTKTHVKTFLEKEVL